MSQFRLLISFVFIILLSACDSIDFANKAKSSEGQVTTAGQQEASGVVYGRSDSCSSSYLIGAVNSATDCNTFSKTDPSWSIMVDGVCKNISDTTALVACTQVQGEDSGIVFGRSDSCNSSYALGAVNDFTDCNTFNNADPAWSIMVDGKCKNISDTSAVIACTQIQGNESGIVFGRSDSCSSSYTIGAVNEFTDCNTFSSTDPAWSILVNGACKNISDTTALVACTQIQGGGNDPSSGIVYGRSDSCSSSYAIGAVNRVTDCNTFSKTDPSWSISVGGTCKNISDTTALVACTQVQGSDSGIVFGRSDSCSSSYAIGAVNEFTDCNTFSKTDPAWSVMEGGVCKNISDTTALVACTQVQGPQAGIIFGRSDSCSSSYAIGAVNEFTDCNMFSNSDPSWSILKDGSCINISDTTALIACTQIQAEFR